MNSNRSLSMVLLANPGPSMIAFLESSLGSEAESRATRGYLKNGSNLVVFSTLGSAAIPEVLNITKNEAGACIFLLSDEKLRHRVRAYGLNRVVLRNYYKPGFLFYRQFVLPLFPLVENDTLMDFGSEVGRRYWWSFVGQKKSDREVMTEVFEAPGKSKILLTDTFNDQQEGLGAKELSRVYRDSIFVLCPFGNLNPDTFRVTEALSHGAIPVVLRFRGIDYFQFIFGEHPFVVADSWSEARQMCEQLIRDQDLLRMRQQAIVEWYQNFLTSLSRDLVKIIHGAKPRHLESDQFRLQWRKRFSPRVVLIFWAHFLWGPWYQDFRRWGNRNQIRLRKIFVERKTGTPSD